MAGDKDGHWYARNPDWEKLMDSDVKDAVRENYGAVARSSIGGDLDGARRIAEAFGYSARELESIPADANMGLSCGNPTATANLRAGEVVVDLGCGGGLDVFLAARKLGPTGKAIGVDMTPAMIDRARRNAAKAGFENVEFLHGEIEALPLSDASVDCVISNCVLNLAPDKRKVFAEMGRVLKPGGRVAVSDIAIKKPLPAELADDLLAYVGCIAGAISFEAYETGLRSAGFDAIRILDAGSDLNAYAEMDGQSGCCSPAMDPGDPLAVLADDSGCCSPEPDSQLHARLGELLKRYDVNEFAASVRVYAVKPSA